ncbi:HAD family hydrolase [Candidatus Bathyarchaeota archaeon]|nr:HAD family hydrolase [Candidatus Bathyarchaeota archaeon]
MGNKCVFLDRDGVICNEVTYMSDPSQFCLLKKVGESLRKLTQRNYKLVVVSNQSGIALGYLTEKDVQKVNDKMVSELTKYCVSFDGIYYCPHHPEGKGIYRRICNCRKPKPGMLLSAATELNIDLSLSYMIGDKKSDIAAGANAGCTTILVLTGYGQEELRLLEETNSLKPDYIVNNLGEAVQIILTKG